MHVRTGNLLHILHLIDMHILLPCRVVIHIYYVRSKWNVVVDEVRCKRKMTYALYDDDIISSQCAPIALEYNRTIASSQLAKILSVSKGDYYDVILQLLVNMLHNSSTGSMHVMHCHN